MTTFGLIGAAGYIAPRHMKAIKAVGGDLIVALDPNDSVGVMDSYFPNAHFFLEFERFDRHIDKLQRSGRPLDYITVCSPNYLHDAHCRFAMRSGADAICEKPLVLNPWNIDGLTQIEASTGKRISTILQLRLHPALKALKARLEADDTNNHEVALTYVTSRGRWYHESWKGAEEKSGGITTNIGIHFFDMLLWLFGTPEKSDLYLRDDHRASGVMRCKKANISWFLSVNSDDLPDAVRGKQPTYRSILIDGEEVEFSDGFNDLHILSYQEILAGRGFGLDVVRPSIELVSGIRGAPVQGHNAAAHPFMAKLA